MRKIKYVHQAEVLSVYDGDTIHAQLDLGFRVMFQVRVRLAGIDAAEISTIAGKEAKDFLSSLLPAGTKIVCESLRLDKFGRSLAIVSLPKAKLSINQQILAAGFAVELLED